MNTKQQLEKDLEEIKHTVQHALDYAKKQGADQAEVDMSRQQGLSVSTRNTELETVEFNQDGALGITVYAKNCKGSASTSDLSREAIEKTVEAACRIAQLTEADPCHGLADPDRLARKILDLDLYHQHTVEPEQLTNMAIRSEQAALDAGAHMSDGASANAHYGLKVYGNSHQFLEGYISSRYSMSTVAIAKNQDKMQRDYDYTQHRKFDALARPEIIGQEAAHKAQAKLNARKLKTQNLPVIFHRNVATGLFGHFVSAISGGNLYRKSSFLLDSLGQPIFPKSISIQENPHILQGLASAPFDAEGIQTQPSTIIDQGVLQTYLLTSYSGKKMNLPSTGHAGGIYNWQVSHTDMSHEALLKEMDTGILVTEVMGQGVNIVTGHYSRGAAGFYVENGEIQYPVEEITIAGNLKEMYQQIIGIDNEPDPRSSLKTGAVLIESMKIAGEA